MDLSSSLFQSWAPHVRMLYTIEESWSIPGLPAFLKAACSLKELSIFCSTELGAAQVWNAHLSSGSSGRTCSHSTGATSCLWQVSHLLRSCTTVTSVAVAGQVR